MPNQRFVDYIPSGEKSGAMTNEGYQDYVPSPKPRPKEEIIKEEEVTKEEVKRPKRRVINE